MLILKNFVISLSSALERRQHIEQVFNEQGIEFEFFDAVTPAQAKILAMQYFPECDLTRLTPTELACAISHIEVWKRAQAYNSKYFSVFEDDIYLGKDSHLFLKNHDWIKRDFHILKLETFLEKVIVGQEEEEYFGRKICQLRHYHFGAAGYLLNKDIVDLLINKVRSNNKFKAIDWILFHDPIIEESVKVYQLYPALCIQDQILNEVKKFPSFLEGDRAQYTFRKDQITIGKKIKREILKCYRQLIGVFIFKIIPYK